MSEAYNIYCDESCHLENDKQNIMVLGAIWCPKIKAKEFFSEIREIKNKNNLNINFEIKWTKISPAKLNFYLDVVNYFFNNDNMHFRALIALEKDKLRHENFAQDHDTWYYKMYFNMLKVILDPKYRYRIYLDIKDTRSGIKMEKLHDVLCNNFYDFSRSVIEGVQSVNSQEIELLQLTDLLIGAVSYINRGLSSSGAKLELINLIKKRSRYSLKATTLVREEKFNLFFWRPEIEEEQ